MRTVNFREGVLHPLVYLLGLRPSILMPEKAATLINFINQRLNQFYDRADFPEWTRTEARAPDVSHIVPWEQAGQTPIGKVFRVYLRNPDLFGSGPLDTPFRLTPAGVYVGLEHGFQVWLKYLPRVDQWPSAIWSSSATYPIGALVYEPVSGEGYRKLSTAAAGTAVTNTAAWAQLAFPWALAIPIVRAAYADALRDEGQNEKAQAEEAFAEQIFAQRLGAQAVQNTDVLTDQEVRARRYRTPIAA